jgi:hypothetical protein
VLSWLAYCTKKTRAYIYVTYASSRESTRSFGKDRGKLKATKLNTKEP